MKFILILILATTLRGQVTIRFTPEDMAVPTAVVANARNMGRWIIEGCNMAPMPVLIASEQIDMVAGPIRFIDEPDATLVLTANVKRSVWGTILQVASIAGQGVAIGTAIAGTIKNPTVTTMIGIGSGLLPQIVTLARGQQPSIVPLQSQLKYPLTLAPVGQAGACFTDHRFAAKMKAPQIVVAVIK